MQYLTSELTTQYCRIYASANRVNIGSDNGLSPIAGLLSIGALEINVCDIFIAIHTFWYIKIHLKIASAKWRPFFQGAMS